MNLSKRGTGRTTRMIEHAVSLALAGERVTVVMLNHQDQNAATMLARVTTGNAAMPVTANLHIATMNDMRFIDWVNLEIQDSNRVLLVDHAVIEYRFRRIIAEWTLFDTQEAGVPTEVGKGQYTPPARRLRLGSTQ